MNLTMPKDLFSKKNLISYLFILFGTFFVASGYILFITPYKIVPGGIYGISIVLHYLINVPIGLTALVFNIPLAIIATKILGPKFGYKTVMAFVLTAVFVDIISYITQLKALVPDEALLSAIYGGAIIGLGVALIFKGKATSAGTDVVAMIISKYTRLPVGQMMIVVDSCVVLFGLIAFGDWRVPLFSWITIFIMGKVIDAIMDGVSYEKTLFIISDKHELIREKIINDIKRGGTLIEAKGMFNKSPKTIIYTVVNRREQAMIEEFINEVDENAFMTIINANEIIGKGFKSMKEKMEK